MNFETLANHIERVDQTLKTQVAHAVNLALTTRNWLLGYYIVEYEQHGEDRAAYGDKLLQKLEKRLNGKGLNVRRFREYRRLYIVFPQLSEPIAKYIIGSGTIRRLLTAELEGLSIRRSTTAELTITNESTEEELPNINAEDLFMKIPCTHLITISSIVNPLKRAFYEMETIRGCWTVKELDRQISSLYYERSAISKDKDALSAHIAKTVATMRPTDIIKSPLSLEFLELNEKAVVTETDLEQAILNHLQEFFLEIGTGFCFEARQKRILVDEDYFKADLVFYHRILKCHVIVELKVDRFRHEYASQLNLYLNYYKNEVMQPDDNPPIGILLCTGYGETTVKYTTAGLDNNLFVSKYMLNLPSEEEIKRYICNNIE